MARKAPANSEVIYLGFPFVYFSSGNGDVQVSAGTRRDRGVGASHHGARPGVISKYRNKLTHQSNGKKKAISGMVWMVVGILLLAVAIAWGTWIIVVNNVEHPKHHVITRDGDIEVRAYPKLVVAEVTQHGDRKSAATSGFRRLADYIFGKKRAGEKIAMTAPVTQLNVALREGNEWVVRFMMPSSYRLESLPDPADSEVRLLTVPAMHRAAVRFSGVATDERLRLFEAQLRDWVASRGLKTVGPATYAYYNDPFTPPPLRRNEVLVDLADGPGN